MAPRARLANLLALSSLVAVAIALGALATFALRSCFVRDPPDPVLTPERPAPPPAPVPADTSVVGVPRDVGRVTRFGTRHHPRPEGRPS